MPTVDHVGISRRIENEKERRRLRELVDRYRPPGTGFIVRTVAENEASEKLTADIKFLLGLWNEVGKKRESMKAPACVHPDLDLILRSIRDLFFRRGGEAGGRRPLRVRAGPRLRRAGRAGAQGKVSSCMAARSRSSTNTASSRSWSARRTGRSG